MLNDVPGEIPPEIGRLLNLVHLDLSINELCGMLLKFSLIFSMKYSSLTNELHFHFDC